MAPGQNDPLIYVNGFEGLPRGSKIFLRKNSHGVPEVRFKGDAGMVDDGAVMRAIARMLPSDLSWDGIVALAAKNEREKPIVQPGKRAWDAVLPMPTPRDFETITPELKSHPIPEPLQLLVDDREPLDMVTLLRTVENLDVHIARLDVGDYVVDGVLAIERKTVDDLISSAIDGEKRLFRQAAALAASGMRSLVLVEGDIYAQTRLPIRRIDSLLSYLIVVRGIAVVQSKTLPHSAEIIAKLIRHAKFGLGYADPGLVNTMRKDSERGGLYLLTCIPGVSETIAGRLLEQFGSVAGTGAASVKELRAVHGVGPTVAQAIRKVLAGE
jgi:ERCC4-type nuclease